MRLRRFMSRVRLGPRGRRCWFYRLSGLARFVRGLPARLDRLDFTLLTWTGMRRYRLDIEEKVDHFAVLNVIVFALASQFPGGSD